MSEEEIKLRLFECIATNSNKLCNKGKYMDTDCVAHNVNEVYNILFKKK